MARIASVRESGPWFAYDTCSAAALRESRYVWLFVATSSGDLTRTNTSRVLVSSDETVLLSSVAIGAPREVLPSWAYTHWRLEAHGHTVVDAPMWIPPDKILSASEDLYLEHIASAMSESPRPAPPEITGLESPVGWSFARWTFPRGVQLSHRDGLAFEVHLPAAVPLLPEGDLRFVLRGLRARDVR